MISTGGQLASLAVMDQTRLWPLIEKAKPTLTCWQACKVEAQMDTSKVSPDNLNAEMASAPWLTLETDVIVVGKPGRWHG